MKKQFYILGAVVAAILMVVFFTSTGGSSSGSLVQIEERDDNYDYVEEYGDELDNGDMVLAQSGTVFVDIKGEVRNPGVFEVDADARVIDVVNMAGGLTDIAQDMAVNLAGRVYDEMKIFVPNIYDKPVENIVASVSGEVSSEETSTSGGASLISINHATALELQSLPGIGPVVSGAIVAHREANGPFSSIDDLINVQGIGTGILGNIRDLIEL